MANQIKGLLQMLRSGGAPKGVAALHSVDDIRRYAKKRLPKMIYDFVYGGATMRRPWRFWDEPDSMKSMCPR